MLVVVTTGGSCVTMKIASVPSSTSTTSPTSAATPPSGHGHGGRDAHRRRAQDRGKKIRVRTIKRGACVEVGHDLFDEKVTDFLNKVGRENIIHMSTVGYGAMDSTGHMLPDYGILIVYFG